MRNKENLIFTRKSRAVMSLICLCSLCILYGCTKKEELVLLAEDGQEQSEVQDLENVGDVGKAGGPAYIEEEPGTVYVHVCGAVITPGVYELTAGSRVYEAVQAAGGFAEDAEENYVNQAQELQDGVKLVIPTREEALLAGQKDSEGQREPEQEYGWQESGQASSEGGRININTASVEELCKIPGIGATRAAAIVSYREDHGGFKNPEDIMQVSGIKEGTYEKIKNNISVK